MTQRNFLITFNKQSNCYCYIYKTNNAYFFEGILLVTIITLLQNILCLNTNKHQAKKYSNCHEKCIKNKFYFFLFFVLSHERNLISITVYHAILISNDAIEKKSISSF